MRSTRDRVLVALVPALVIAVAAVQIGRAHTVDQSSWSGAGFGMFATYDSELHRFVLLEVEQGDGGRAVILAPESRAVVEARVVPSRGALLAVAEAAAPDVDGTIVRVEVDGIRFSHDGARVEPYVVRSVEVAT